MCLPGLEGRSPFLHTVPTVLRLAVEQKWKGSFFSHWRETITILAPWKGLGEWAQTWSQPRLPV